MSSLVIILACVLTGVPVDRDWAQSAKTPSTNMRVKRRTVTLFLLIVLCNAASEVLPQRSAVTGAEVTGTFRYFFKGKYRGNYNEILIQALGRNKLKIEMELIFPYTANREQLANVGTASGEAVINGDTAVFEPEYSVEQGGDQRCKITLKFTKPGTLVVSTEHNINCGFGFNVSADGTYQKTSSAKPKFRNDEDK